MPKTEETFTLTLTLTELQVAMAAVGKLPWDVANPLIATVQQQVRAQQDAASVAEPAQQVRRAPAPAAEAVVDEDEAPAPVRRRTVQDTPDPLPRTARRVPARNGADHDEVEPALAADMLAEPARSSRV